MGTYIFQAEVFLSLCGMWIRRLDVFFSRRAQTHAGARVSETSRRARNASRTSYATPQNKRERETKKPGSDWMRDVLFFLNITRSTRAMSAFVYVNQLGSPLGIIPYGFNATCEVK